MFIQPPPATTQLFEGYWWPAGAAEQTAGRVEIDRDRITLRLNGRFAPPTLTRMQSTEYAIVYGISGSRRITLRGCWEISSTLITSGVPTQEFVVGAVWLDLHVREFIAKRLFLRIEHLASWFQAASPRISAPRQPDGATSAQHVGVSPMAARTPLGEVTLRVQHSTESTLESVTLSSAASFLVDLPQPRPYDDADREVVRPLQNLVTLAATRPAAIVELAVQLPPDAIIDPRDREPEHWATVVTTWLVPPGANPRRMWPDELSFMAADLASDFSGSLATWFQAHEDMPAACDLFFGNQYAPPRFLETRFLVHCQAAEALHARRFDSLRMSRDAHQTRTEHVLSFLPPEHQTWVRSALTGSNQKSLRDRLLELVLSAPAPVQQVIGDARLYADCVRVRRNRITHGSSLAGDVDELLALNAKLRLLLHAHLMRELRLGPDVIDSRIASSRLLRETQLLASRV